MAAIRWYLMSRALADLGHSVDILHGRYKWRLRQPVHEIADRLREVPLSRARWEDYDVVKTLFHRGFETLERFGGGEHPFVISKLGSVVGPEDAPGIYFYGKHRERLYRVQERIQAKSRFITVLTEPARDLWRTCHGDRGNLLLVPGAAEDRIPAPGADPYPTPRGAGRRVVCAGNFYSQGPGSQPEAHRTLAAKLNGVGARLRSRGIRLYVIGTGDAASLDPESVAYLGVVPYEETWDYLRYADVGLVVSAGPFMHNNESTRVYHYLRAGLPVVSESGFPNDHVVRESGHGFLVEPGNLNELARMLEAAAGGSWERGRAEEYILSHHTWDVRARVYDDVIRDASRADARVVTA
jgi:glycosyltransferase involved in cell wall biosynthesis